MAFLSELVQDLVDRKIVKVDKGHNLGTVTTEMITQLRKTNPGNLRILSISRASKANDKLLTDLINKYMFGLSGAGIAIPTVIDAMDESEISQPGRLNMNKTGGEISPEKARIMINEGNFDSDKQRRYFYHRANQKR